MFQGFLCSIVRAVFVLFFFFFFFCVCVLLFFVFVCLFVFTLGTKLFGLTKHFNRSDHLLLLVVNQCCS